MPEQEEAPAQIAANPIAITKALVLEEAWPRHMSKVLETTPRPELLQVKRVLLASSLGRNMTKAHNIKVTGKGHTSKDPINNRHMANNMYNPKDKVEAEWVLRVQVHWD